MGIIVALIPALLWGCTPLWTHLCGGSAFQQLVGSTYGAFIIGIVMYLIVRPAMSVSGFIWCLLSGVGWSLGQLTTYISYKRISVSTTAPIMSGVPLAAVSVVGVLFFNEWPGSLAKVIGGLAVIVVIIGVIFTTKGGNNQKKPGVKNNASYIRNVMVLVFGVGIGFTAEGCLPRIPGTNGFTTYPPQSLGMILGAILFALLSSRDRNVKTFFGKHTFKNLLTGFSCGFGAFAYLVGMMLVGIGSGYTLSQMSVAVSVLIGLVVLHEHKRGKKLANTLIGVVLVIVGGVLTSIAA